MKVMFKMQVVEKTALPVSGVYQRIYLQGQPFIHGLSAVESFVRADSFHYFTSVAMSL